MLILQHLFVYGMIIYIIKIILMLILCCNLTNKLFADSSWILISVNLLYGVSSLYVYVSFIQTHRWWSIKFYSIYFCNSNHVLMIQQVFIIYKYNFSLISLSFGERRKNKYSKFALLETIKWFSPTYDILEECASFESASLLSIQNSLIFSQQCSVYVKRISNQKNQLQFRKVRGITINLRNKERCRIFKFNVRMDWN